MDRAAILRKTSKGEEAIRTRAHDLPRQLRVALILVDGVSSLERLLEKGAGLPDVQAALSSLHEQGFVEIVGGAAVDYATLKQQLIDIAEDVLGEDADKVVKKLRAAEESREGLLSTLNGCKKIVTLFIDEAKGDELMSRCERLLRSSL